MNVKELLAEEMAKKFSQIVTGVAAHGVLAKTIGQDEVREFVKTLLMADRELNKNLYNNFLEGIKCFENLGLEKIEEE